MSWIRSRGGRVDRDAWRRAGSSVNARGAQRAKETSQTAPTRPSSKAKLCAHALSSPPPPVGAVVSDSQSIVDDRTSPGNDFVSSGNEGGPPIQDQVRDEGSQGPAVKPVIGIGQAGEAQAPRAFPDPQDGMEPSMGPGNSHPRMLAGFGPMSANLESAKSGREENTCTDSAKSGSKPANLS